MSFRTILSNLLFPTVVIIMTFFINTYHVPAWSRFKTYPRGLSGEVIGQKAIEAALWTSRRRKQKKRKRGLRE